jgi:hypothetical protein
MKSLVPLVMILLLAVSVQAQSLAEAARKERERQSTLKPAFVFTSLGKSAETKPAGSESADGKAADGKPAGEAAAAGLPSKELPKETPKPQAPPTADPAQAWNAQLDQLRAKIRGLQDQELALQLQQNQATNQVYAPVTDPATQERAQQLLRLTLQQLETVRADLNGARRSFDALQLEGPPKK